MKAAAIIIIVLLALAIIGYITYTVSQSATKQKISDTLASANPPQDSSLDTSSGDFSEIDKTLGALE